MVPSNNRRQRCERKMTELTGYCFGLSVCTTTPPPFPAKSHVGIFITSMMLLGKGLLEINQVIRLDHHDWHINRGNDGDYSL